MLHRWRFWEISRPVWAKPARRLSAHYAAPGGSKANHARALALGTTFGSASEPLQLVLCDAQTSGGLLIAVPSERVGSLLQTLVSSGVNRAAVIGRITDEQALKVG